MLGQNLTTEVQGGSYAAGTMHERILADIIRSDEQKTTTHLRWQVLKPIVAFNYGASALDSTPWPHWDTTPPEDQSKRATMLAALIPAIDNAERVGQAINTDELLASFGLPIVPPEERTFERGKLFKYHLDHGVVSRNEVREGLGHKPRPGEDKLIEPSQVGGAFSESAQLADDVRPESRALVDGHDYADAVATSAMRKQPMAPTLEAVAKLIDGADSFEDVERGVVGLYADLPQDSMARTLQRALLLWRLNGRHAVNEEV